METAATEGPSEGGGYWNWDDLPEDVQLQFQQMYFSASNTIYQQALSQASQAVQK